MTFHLNAEQVSEFQKNGILIIKGFYDLESEIVPIQRDIYRIIGLLINKYRLPIQRPPFAPEVFDAGYQDLIAANRAYGSEVYDAIKQIPTFIRLVANRSHDELFRMLRPDSFPAVAGGGYGIRIDNPFEDRFRANWHQEYPAQLRSRDGLVYWSPLLAITEELGPVQVCPGSHLEGPIPVHTSVSGGDQTGAYALVLQHEAERLARYATIAPLTEPGDLIVMDFMLLHASGDNRGKRSRWSMQLRYFNFYEATGISHGWKGSYAAGVDFRQVHPELCVD
jgi:hypothetical protein